MLAFLLLVVSIFNIGLGQVSPPIPLLATDPGIPYNRSTSARAPIVLEAVIELNCGDSAYAFLELKEVVAFYGAETLDLIYHQLPLPYHRNAFLQAQGLYLIQEELPDQVFNYIEAMLSQTFRFSTGATRNMSEFQVIDMMAETAADATGIDPVLFANEVNNYISPAISSWKYAARRGMAGTPMFILNNIDLAQNPSNRLSYEDWRAIIDPLLDDLRA